jgi:TM2 domain-containing membrane protein YozV
MNSTMQIICPHCHRNLKVAGATVGKQVRCPQCHGFIRVPDSATTSATAPPRGWMVRTENGKIYGPASREELEQWVQEGRVQAECQVSPEGDQQWIWAAEMFPQLAAQQDPVARPPYAPHHPASMQSPPHLSDRSRLVAGLLGLLLPVVGIFGVHRLYTGHIGLGVLMLVTCGGCGIWQLIDVILVFAGAVTDANGLPLRE